ncbi:MAG: FAD-binding oxidoreductase, partial [Deltaproteobacteria bacterium]|nr:FAD-binding oxidoreductase [Deltaproteobacteria bacterium]
MTISTDIIIIGGGLQGCSTALHLARKGKSVIILEKETP